MHHSSSRAACRWGGQRARQAGPDEQACTALLCFTHHGVLRWAHKGGRLDLVLQLGLDLCICWVCRSRRSSPCSRSSRRSTPCGRSVRCSRHCSLPRSCRRCRTPSAQASSFVSAACGSFPAVARHVAHLRACFLPPLLLRLLGLRLRRLGARAARLQGSDRLRARDNAAVHCLACCASPIPHGCEHRAPAPGSLCVQEG